MNLNEELDRQHKIDLYLQNAMSDSERILFEKEMESDEFLKEEVLLQKSIIESLSEKEIPHIRDDKKEVETSQIESILQNPVYQEHQKHIESVAKTYQRKQQRRKLWFIGAAAAILLAVSSILLFPSKESYETLYAEYADWSEMTSYIEQSDQNNFAEGELLYRNQKYAEAIEFFKKFTQDSNQKLYAPGLIYLGASYFENKDIANALSTFDKLIESNSYDRSKGHWYKLLIYLHQKDQNGVNRTLESILKDSSNFNYKKALQIKESL